MPSVVEVGQCMRPHQCHHYLECQLKRPWQGSKPVLSAIHGDDPPLRSPRHSQPKGNKKNAKMLENNHSLFPYSPWQHVCVEPLPSESVAW